MMKLIAVKSPHVSTKTLKRTAGWDIIFFKCDFNFNDEGENEQWVY
jgi:hypothetical protein